MRIALTTPLALLLSCVAGGACRSEPADERAAAPADAGPRERFVEWPQGSGHRLHYLDAGPRTDEALVLVHGWASSVATWREQFPDLADRARTLAVDLPGHGASDPPAGEYGMAPFADAVAAAMDDAGVERAVLVGHSNGAPVALKFLRRHPARTLGLVVLDGALESMFTAEQAEGVFAPFRGERWKEVMEAFVRGMPGPGLAPEDREAIVAMALGTRQEAVIGGFEAAVAPDAFDEAPIDVPLLVVLAEQPTWSEEYEASVRARAPRVDWRVWSGASHFLHMERPEAVRAALLEWLGTNGLL